jgi:Fic family protein
MKRGLQGKYIKISIPGEDVRAYVPAPLPPIPSIDWTPQLRGKYDQALLALGKLDSVSVLLPETSLFLYMYVRKEAVLSSMIEGTQSSLSDLLLFEIDQQPGVPLNDVQEVSNYVAALNYGLKRLADGFPLSLRLIREIHGVLLAKGRGSSQTPGDFRRSQNWIGGTRPGNAAFVPPPADKVMECMGKLELFLHDEKADSPALFKAALAHVQFETIHPFLDGNGRLGRLLITLLLSDQKIVKKPMLYLSLYIKAHRHYYYELLNNVRLTGDWEAWLDFFADAVIATAEQAIETAKQLLALLERDRHAIEPLKRAAVSTRKIYEALLERPIVNSAWLEEKTGISQATVNKCIGHLKTLGIVQELTAKKRNRLYSYTEYVGILNKGTELPE